MVVRTLTIIFQKSRTISINFTNLTANFIDPTKPIVINTVDVVKNVCTQIDDKIVLCSLLILTFWVLQKVMIPRIYNTFLPIFDDFLPKYSNDFRVITVHLVSFLETACLISACVLVAFAFLQYKFSLFKTVWLIFLGGVIVVTVLAELIGYLRRKFGKKRCEVVVNGKSSGQ